MYRLKKNGAEVALVNEMQFVRMQDNGAYGSSGQLQADGVAADNQVFLFPGDVDTVEYVDGAAELEILNIILGGE